MTPGVEDGGVTPGGSEDSESTGSPALVSVARKGGICSVGMQSRARI